MRPTYATQVRHWLSLWITYEQLRMVVFALVLSLTLPSLADSRLINNKLVDLSPIYQWQRTNGPASTRPLTAWKQMRVLSVDGSVSVYHQCTVIIDRETKHIIVDHLPSNVVDIFSRRTRLNSRKLELENFISSEKKRLRLLNSQSINWDIDSPAYRNLQLDNANLENRRDELEQVDLDLGSLGRRAATECLDFAILMNRKYGPFEIWDIGLKR